MSEYVPVKEEEVMKTLKENMYPCSATLNNRKKLF